MKKLILKTITALISFVFLMELISFVSAEKHLMRSNVEGFNFYDEKNENDVYFIGDSYAQTIYAEEGYPQILRDYFKNRGWNFYDLSVPGSTIKEHKPLLDSISELNPKLVIYFYHISNGRHLDKVLQEFKENQAVGQEAISRTNKIRTKKNKRRGFIDFVYDNSATILLIKKSLQYFSLMFTDEYYPGSPAYMFPAQNQNMRNELEIYFRSIQAENVFILVNTQFAAGGKPKKWEHYEVFKNFEQNKEFEIMQTVDIINDPDYSLSWRNNHPNQEAIKIIADTLIRVFDEIK